MLFRSLSGRIQVPVPALVHLQNASMDVTVNYTYYVHITNVNKLQENSLWTLSYIKALYRVSLSPPDLDYPSQLFYYNASMHIRSYCLFKLRMSNDVQGFQLTT